MEGHTVFESALCREGEQRPLAKTENVFTLLIQHFSIINIESYTVVSIYMNTLKLREIVTGESPYSQFHRR